MGSPEVVGNVAIVGSSWAVVSLVVAPEGPSEGETSWWLPGSLGASSVVSSAVVRSLGASEGASVGSWCSSASVGASLGSSGDVRSAAGVCSSAVVEGVVCASPGCVSACVVSHGVAIGSVVLRSAEVSGEWVAASSVLCSVVALLSGWLWVLSDATTVPSLSMSVSVRLGGAVG